MPSIIVDENESFESALKRFKKKVEKEGIIAEVKRHQRYEKPSEKRQRKIAAAKRKQRKKQIKFTRRG